MTKGNARLLFLAANALCWIAAVWIVAMIYQSLKNFGVL